MKTIKPFELAALLEDSQPVDILDIRSRSQFETAHIEGSHWLRTADISAETLLFERELWQTEPLYLVSESGAFAQITASELERQGLDNVVVLSGGMQGWQRASLPVAGELRVRTLQEVA